MKNNEYEDKIYFRFRGKRYYIRMNSIAGYLITFIEIMIVFLAMVMPYFAAVIMADCLGF